MVDRPSTERSQLGTPAWPPPWWPTARPLVIAGLLALAAWMASKGGDIVLPETAPTGWFYLWFAALCVGTAGVLSDMVPVPPSVVRWGLGLWMLIGLAGFVVAMLVRADEADRPVAPPPTSIPTVTVTTLLPVGPPSYVCASNIAPLNGRGAYGLLVEFGMREGETQGFVVTVGGLPGPSFETGWQYREWWGQPLRTDATAGQPIAGSGLISWSGTAFTRGLPPPANISRRMSLYLYFETPTKVTSPTFSFLTDWITQDEPGAEEEGRRFAKCPR